jgi:uncharacterized Ntn-hydrolase superfamily protein
MTFSIVARCPNSAQFGVAVASSSPAVAARCAHARAGVGAVATQNVTDPRLGPLGLDMLARGLDPAIAVAGLQQVAGPHGPWRQVAAIGATGPGAAFSGSRALGRNGHAIGTDAVAAGNMLAADTVLPAMLHAFAAEAPLAERLLRALEAALAAGGEEGPIHSAGLLVMAEQAWPLVDLRVDWHDTAPIAALRALWTLWQPQMDAYVTRALDPADAPSYGVPGDP